jgi:predicted alpha/beta-hydrolase family hydrolase
MKPITGTFEATPEAGNVSTLLLQPEDTRAVYVFGHGAGAGMKHAFMDRMSNTLADHGIATFRYQFPYTEKGRGYPDAKPVLLATVRGAVDAARRALPGVPVFAGGKSMGGRMTSLAAADRNLDEVRGLVFFGFPLHAAGKPSTERGDHLVDVTVPMLFLQGTRDSLAKLELLDPIVNALGKQVTLHRIEGGDHGFRVPRSAGRSEAEVRLELGRVAADWMSRRT